MSPHFLHKLVTLFAAILAACASAQTVTVVEYWNTKLNAYFVTGRVAEQQLLDQSLDFVRTGMNFDAIAAQANAASTPGYGAVCRFYVAGINPFVSSHFYGQKADCDKVRGAAGFADGGVDFSTISPSEGLCPVGTTPVFRNFRSAANGVTPNHRYSVSAASAGVAAQNGYSAAEGVQFCVSRVGDVQTGVRLARANVVQVEYASLFDVFDRPDATRFPNIRVQPSRWNIDKILNDVNLKFVVDEYDAIFVYTSQEIPGWINSGSPFEAPNAKNIGLSNLASGSRFGKWKRLRRALQMNSVEFANDRADMQNFPELIAIHELGHHWSQHMINQCEIGPRNWLVSVHPISYLAAGCFHWSYAFFLGQNTDMPGIMYSGPTSSRFNPFDLYAIGLMGYSEVRSYTFSVAPEPSAQAPYKFYPVNIDTLIEGMRITQPTNVAGDGKRIPDLDPTVASLNALVVVVRGAGDVIPHEKLDRLQALAANLPAVWGNATWGRSIMNTSVKAR